ncbi:hypothetical protein [Actinomadura keratinilytica]|uniref:Uncharacterized protein n=2 Tax=Actinomadura keratinilytica TaxID=547461 RepID=A0ABP7XW59_9ACTN
MAPIGSVALMSPDKRFVEELYNRAIVNVYEPWTRRGVSWVSRAEARRAAHVVSIARQNLAMLTEAEERAEPPHAIRDDWQQAA